MKKSSLTKQQSTELLDNVGEMLTGELESDSTRKKIAKMVSEYLEENMIDEDPKTLANRIRLSVKVSLAEQ
jgi:hypothetical protein